MSGLARRCRSPRAGSVSVHYRPLRSSRLHSAGKLIDLHPHCHPASVLYHARTIEGANAPAVSGRMRVRTSFAVAWLGGIALTLCSAQIAAAQAQNFPNHPVKIIVGPSPDIFSRIVAEH